MKNLEENCYNVCWVIFNGISSVPWRGVPLEGPVFGCNFAYRDFPISDLFAVDRMTVHEIRKDDPLCRCYTKNGNIEVPPGWTVIQTPGIDSGTYALEQACVQYPNLPKFVIGADGILEQDHTTVYDYSWRRGNQPTEKTHLKHRNTFDKIYAQHAEITLVTDTPHNQYRTITHADAIRKASLAIYAERFKQT